MLSYCIFWFTIIFYIILCESASIRREVPASYFSAGRWRPGRPLKRSLLLDYGNTKDTSEADNTILQPQAPFGGVAESLGPQADGHSKSSPSSTIVYLPELNLNGNDNAPMLLADGFGSPFQSPIDGKELNSFEKNALFLMLNNNGENYINNQALKQQQLPTYIIPQNSFQQQQFLKPVVIQQNTAALSKTAQHRL